MRFLLPVMDSPLLTIETEATVTAITMHGNRATGVNYMWNGGRKSASAGEVILAAGAYQTPKLLMISGIGPDDELTRHNIEKRVVLSGVGKNLQDHYECPVVATTKGAFGYYGADRGWPMIKAGPAVFVVQVWPCVDHWCRDVRVLRSRMATMSARRFRCSACPRSISTGM
jgi:choline dehydrogenase